MKTFLLIFIFALSLKAESFYQNRCVDSFYFIDYQSSSPYVIYSKTPTVVNTLTSSATAELINNMGKFKYDPLTNHCNALMQKSNNTLGMTNEQYTFMMALTGLLTSILLVFIIFLKV